MQSLQCAVRVDVYVLQLVIAVVVDPDIQTTATMSH